MTVAGAGAGLKSPGKSPIKKSQPKVHHILVVALCNALGTVFALFITSHAYLHSALIGESTFTVPTQRATASTDRKLMIKHVARSAEFVIATHSK